MLRFRPSEIALTPAEIHQAKERILARRLTHATHATHASYSLASSARPQEGGPHVRRGPERSRDESLVYRHGNMHVTPRRISQISDKSMLNLRSSGLTDRHDSAISGSFEHSGDEAEDDSASTSGFENLSDSYGHEKDGREYTPHTHNLGFSGLSSTRGVSEDLDDALECQPSLDGASDQAHLLERSRPGFRSRPRQNLRIQHAPSGSNLDMSQTAGSSSMQPRLPPYQRTANHLQPPLGRLEGYRHRSNSCSYEQSIPEPFMLYAEQDMDYLNASHVDHSASQQSDIELDPRAAEFVPPTSQFPSSSHFVRQSLRDITGHSDSDPNFAVRGNAYASAARQIARGPAYQPSVIPSRPANLPGSLIANVSASRSSDPYSASWRLQNSFSSSDEPLTWTQNDGSMSIRGLSRDLLRMTPAISRSDAPTPPPRTSSIAFSDRDPRTQANVGAASVTVSPTAAEEALRGCSSPLDRIREEALLRLQALTISDTPASQMPQTSAWTSPATPPPVGNIAYSASEGRAAIRTYNDRCETGTPPRTPTRRPPLPLIDISATAPPVMRRRREVSKRLRRPSRTPMWPTNGESGLPLDALRTGLSSRRRRGPGQDDEENWHTMPGLQEARRVWMARSQNQAVMDSTPPRLTNFERFL